MTADGGDRSLGAPRFDVVLRGYDRRQVDEHVARLQRVLARMRADLDVARSQPLPVVPPPSGGFPATGQPTPPGGSRPRPTPRPRPGVPPAPGESPDMIGSFTDRMQSILQAAEEEAEEIRNQARSGVKANHEAARAELAELTRQRDSVLADLTRLRGQLEGLLSGPTARIAVPPREAGQGGPVQRGAADAQPGPAQPGAAQSGPAPGAAAPPGTGQQAPAQGGSAKPGAGSAQSAPAQPGPAPQAPTGGRSTTSPPPGNRPAAHAASTDTADRIAASTDTADVEATTPMRPRNEPTPQPGDLFRPASEGRREATAGDPDEPVTTAVPRQSPTNASGSTPAPPGAKPGLKGPSGGATAASSDVEETVLVQAVRPAGGTTGSAESGNPGEKDAAPADADKKDPADANPAGTSSAPGADETVKVGLVRPAAPGPKNSTSGGASEKRDDTSKGAGPAKDDGGNAGAKPESGSSASRSDRSASGSRSG